MAEETKAPSGGHGKPSGAQRRGSPRPRRTTRSASRRRPRRSPRRRPQVFRRKKVCKFCVEKIEAVNYKDVRLLAQFVAESGKITPRRLTGVCTPHQRRLSRAIKQARNIACCRSRDARSRFEKIVGRRSLVVRGVF
jgi:small subunit ribosomal protein S18